ncbi:MAG: YgiT-type zinc finger protein [Planctomycetes bacterium]|nr:YgiT-type zinc finger protein [Planctomycetota bacterium]
MYGYKCEYCNGVVREKLLKREVFKHRTGFVMLENVPVGVCDKCGYRYYHSTILQKVEDIANGKQLPERTEIIPVANLR